MRPVWVRERGQLAGIQFQVEGGDCFIQVLDAARADDGRGHARLLAQPGQRDLCIRDPARGRHGGDARNHLAVGILVVELVSEVIAFRARGVASVLLAAGAGDEAASQRLQGMMPTPWSRHSGFISRSSSRYTML